MAGPDDPSDRELFDDAISGLGDAADDDRGDREPRPPQPRDPPTGRFAPREDDGQDDAGDDQDQPPGRVPSYRQREEAERRRAAEERLLRSERMFDQLANRFGSLEEELRALRRPQQEQRERPDVWRDPDGFVQDIDERFQNVQQTAEEIVRDKMINLTFRREHRARGQEFEQAYGALQQMTRRGDRLAHEIVSDGDPGAALMEWYDGERVRMEVGNNPDAFVERRAAERVQKDPNFRVAMARALGFELLDGDGGGYEPARNGRSGNRTLVRLPSVNSASGSAGGNSRGNGQMPVTDGDFFADAVAGLPTSRMRAASRGR